MLGAAYEWDDAKSDHCLRERGFDFDFAIRLFRESNYITTVLSRRYGEERFLSVGNIDDILITVVWTPRSSRKRIISARRASRRERNDYLAGISGKA
jgi:uncharacterized DUF497 family protein